MNDKEIQKNLKQMIDGHLQIINCYHPLVHFPEGHFSGMSIEELRRLEAKLRKESEIREPQN